MIKACLQQEMLVHNLRLNYVISTTGPVERFACIQIYYIQRIYTDIDIPNP